MKNNSNSNLSGAKLLNRFFAVLLCILALQSIMQAQEQQLPEIPAHLRDNPVALRHYLQKQQILQTADRIDLLRN